MMHDRSMPHNDDDDGTFTRDSNQEHSLIFSDCPGVVTTMDSGFSAARITVDEGTFTATMRNAICVVEQCNVRCNEPIHRIIIRAV